MARFAAMLVALVACLEFADARHLLQRASGNNNANGAQRVWAVEGDRNVFASQGTSDAIAAAAASGKAYFAAAFGSKASKATSLRSAVNTVFTPKDGARHLLQGERTDRADRNIIAAQATADLIQSALASKTAKTATKGGVQYSKLATSNSVRASDFTGARHLLQGERTDRADRNIIAAQATADLIQSALSVKSAKTATKGGVQYSKLATSNSVRADFGAK